MSLFDTSVPVPIPLFLVRVAISFGVLGFSLYVIGSKRFAPTAKHWAYATAGSILMYWLKP